MGNLIVIWTSMGESSLLNGILVSYSSKSYADIVRLAVSGEEEC